MFLAISFKANPIVRATMFIFGENFIRKFFAIFLFCILASASGCSGTSNGKLRNLSDLEQNQFMQNFINAWDGYIVRFIPGRALLLDRKTDNRTLLVGSEWIEVANRETWLTLIKMNTRGGTQLELWYPSDGFKEIVGPDGHAHGYLALVNVDLVSIKVVDERTLQLFYLEAKPGP